MCYPKPGPRCSAHAAAALKKASDAFKEAAVSRDEEATITARENLTKAQDDFYMTPKGKEYLKAKIRETGDPSGHLFFKLEYGILAREEAIRLVKATDVGDNDTHAAAAVTAEAEATRLDQEHAETLIRREHSMGIYMEVKAPTTEDVVRIVLGKTYDRVGFSDETELVTEIVGIIDNPVIGVVSDDGSSEAAEAVREKLWNRYTGGGASAYATCDLFIALDRENELGWIRKQLTTRIFTNRRGIQ